MMNNINNNNDWEISWKASDSHFMEKNADWYWIFWLIILLIVFLIYYLTTKNLFIGSFSSSYILIALIIISGLSITMASIIKPSKKLYYLSLKEVIPGDNNPILLSKFKSYKIDLHSKEILLSYKTDLLPLLVLPLSPIVNLKVIQNILDSSLEEDTDLKISKIEKNIAKHLGI